MTKDQLPRSTTADGPDQPTVSDAFSFVLPSIEWSLQRFAAIDGRIQQIMTVAATLTVMSPIAGRAVFPYIQFLDIFFLAAVVFGLFIITRGAYALTHGGLQLLDVEPMRRNHLAKASGRFQRDIITVAGRIQNVNGARIDRRAEVAELLARALAAEALLLVFWITGLVGRISALLGL